MRDLPGSRVFLIQPMFFLIEHEAEADRWRPIGVGEAETLPGLRAAIAELAFDLVPGRFRYLPVGALGDWRYLELDPDGAVLDTLI